MGRTVFSGGRVLDRNQTLASADIAADHQDSWLVPGALP